MDQTWVVEYPPLPDVLYHYTDVDGAIGILESGELWATRTKHLNDATEIEHGRELAISVADALIRESGERDPTLFIRERLADDGLSDWRTTEYLSASAVVSFTATRDDLLHWQSYGRQGSGVALSFDAKQLLQLSTTDPMPVAPEYQLLKVRYEESEKRQLLEELYRYHDIGLSQSLEEPDFEGDPLDEMYMRAITFCAALATFKGEPWTQENEWRLTTTVDGSWRIRGGGVEFVALPVRTPGVGLPLKEILVGSKVGSSDQTRLRKVTEAKLRESIPMTPSSVPLR